jgi:hypothetical protein
MRRQKERGRIEKESRRAVERMGQNTRGRNENK